MFEGGNRYDWRSSIPKYRKKNGVNKKRFLNNPIVRSSLSLFGGTSYWQ